MKKNLKKNACMVLALMMAVGTNAVAFAGDTKTATPSQAAVTVNAKPQKVSAYNIDGYTYFKLRDVAASLHGTDAQFAVGYDAKAKSVTLDTTKGYEAEKVDSTDLKAATTKASDQKVLVDGKEVSMQAYLIDGFNYFQLRELGDKLGFKVTWDDTSKTINMITEKEDKKPEAEDKKDEVSGAKALQKVIDNAKEFDEIFLTDTYVGNTGDKVVVDKSLVFRGKGGVVKNIAVEVATDKQIWIDGVQFDGNKTAKNAILIKNAGADSAIVNCTFDNYKEDAIMIDQLVNDTTFMIAQNKFNEFGLAENKMDAAITLNATKKFDVKLEFFDNEFSVSKEGSEMPEDKMDLMFQNTDVPNAKEIYSNTKVTFLDNKIVKGSEELTVDMATDIPDGNFNFEKFDEAE